MRRLLSTTASRSRPAFCGRAERRHPPCIEPFDDPLRATRSIRSNNIMIGTRARATAACDGSRLAKFNKRSSIRRRLPGRDSRALRGRVQLPGTFRSAAACTKGDGHWRTQFGKPETRNRQKKPKSKNQNQKVRPRMGRSDFDGRGYDLNVYAVNGRGCSRARSACRRHHADPQEGACRLGRRHRADHSRRGERP